MNALLLMGALAAAQPDGGDAQLRQVSLLEAQDLAARQSPLLAVAGEALAAASARRKSVRGYLLPSVKMEGAALWWNDVSEVPMEAFYGDLFAGDPCAEMEDYLVQMCTDFMDGFAEGMEESMGEAILLREQRTQQLKATATQPLTGLYGISQGLRATRAMERAAAAELDGTRSQVALDVVDAWFGALEVERLEQVATQAVRTLEAHQERAQAFHQAGMLGRNELLQIEVALSEARLGQQRAQVGRQLTQRRLALVTGSDARRLAPLDVDLDPLPALQVEAAALRTRVPGTPAVRAMEAQAEAALAERNRLHAERVPQLAALASWERNWGLGSLAEEETLFLGLGMEWELWGWGRKHYEAQEAAAQARQAQLGLRALRQGAELEAEAVLADARLALAAYHASQTTTTQADENQRIVAARFEAHSATATDLLEAETLRTKARGDELAAAFDYMIALARAQDALGLPVLPLEGLVLRVEP